MNIRKANISEALVRVLSKALANQRIPRRYGLEKILYPAEVHMVMLIGRYPKYGVTELAAKAGTTKGAVSQVIQRLIKKKDSYINLQVLSVVEECFLGSRIEGKLFSIRMNNFMRKAI